MGVARGRAHNAIEYDAIAGGVSNGSSTSSRRSKLTKKERERILVRRENARLLSAREEREKLLQEEKDLERLEVSRQADEIMSTPHIP